MKLTRSPASLAACMRMNEVFATRTNGSTSKSGMSITGRRKDEAGVGGEDLPSPGDQAILAGAARPDDEDEGAAKGQDGHERRRTLPGS